MDFVFHLINEVLLLVGACLLFVIYKSKGEEKKLNITWVFLGVFLLAIFLGLVFMAISLVRQCRNPKSNPTVLPE